MNKNINPIEQAEARTLAFHSALQTIKNYYEAKKREPKTIRTILLDHEEAKEIKSFIGKIYEEFKKQILTLESGQYEDMILGFQERQVKEYIVSARVDRIIQIMRLEKK